MIAVVNIVQKIARMLISRNSHASFAKQGLPYTILYKVVADRLLIHAEA